MNYISVLMALLKKNRKPEGCEYLLLDAVVEMDIRAFYEKYREDGKGQSAF
jgi:hypothetical protein